MSNLRAPICGIFGHVDSGKTSFLSKLKSFETIEAGGITQGTSSIFISIDKIKTICKKIVDLKEVLLNKEVTEEFTIKIPGILFIDTPGHESFANFRQKASDICDLGIIIIDIEKGVEKQAVESIQMLLNKKIPFICVLTKLDKVEGWQIIETPNLRQSLKNQSQETVTHLNMLMEDIKFELSKCSINAEFYFKNKTPRKVISLIPVSNKSGEGFNDIVNYLIFITQNFMEQKLIMSQQPKMFVMEKSFDKTNGWMCNIILSDGIINNGNKIIFPTINGPEKSVIRNMIGTKFDTNINRFVYTHQKELEASGSINIFAPNLENIIVGSYINVYNNEKEYNEIAKTYETVEIKDNFIVKLRIKSNEENKYGYYLFTSSISDFEAAYQVCTDNKVLITNGSCGPLTEKEIDIAHIYFSKNEKNNTENLAELRTILYWTSQDNKSPNYDELVAYAKNKDINIVFNDVIYKLIDDFNNLKQNLINIRKEAYTKEGKVVLPVEIKLLKQFIFMKGASNSHILIGFKVLEGKLNIGTEMVAINNNTVINLGTVIKMEKNHKEIQTANKNDEVCVKLNNPNGFIYGKHFNEKDIFISNMSRSGLEIMKRDFRNDLSKDEWILTAKIAKTLKI